MRRAPAAARDLALYALVPGYEESTLGQSSASQAMTALFE
jgi:hypothetical protein